MIMHLYDRAGSTGPGSAVGWTKDTPTCSRAIERDASGNPTGLVMSTTSSRAWSRCGAHPRLSPEDQILSTRHFMREHNRLGVTSVIDAAAAVRIIRKLHRDREARRGRADDAADRLHPVRPGARQGLDNYTAWAKLVKFGRATTTTA